MTGKKVEWWRKEVYDFPELMESGEPLLTFAEAVKLFPMQVNRIMFDRWIRIGCRGSILKTVRFGLRRYTTESAIREFIRGQFNLPPTQSTISPDEKAKAE